MLEIIVNKVRWGLDFAFWMSYICITMNPTQTERKMVAQKHYFGLKVPRDLLHWLQDKSERECESISTLIRNILKEARTRDMLQMETFNLAPSIPIDRREQSRRDDE